jgi:hypothetical protein
MKSAVTVLGLFLASYLAAQSTPPPNPQEPTQADLEAVVKKQFGDTFRVKSKFPTPVIVADFDGDGVEDVAIVATSTEPFPDSYAFKYQVVDPYNAYFGWGNSSMTAELTTVDPARNHDLLVIFGAGKEGWHAAVPKAKFVMINVPCDDIAVGRMLIKKDKPPVFVIKAREFELMDSAVWWDAKKKRWRWEPGDTKS